MNMLQRPWIKALRRRYALQIMFIRARLLSHGYYFGVQMTVGALMLANAGWLFGDISEDITTGDPLTIVDLNVAKWFHAQATPLVTQFVTFFTNLHGVTAISSYTALLALYLIWKQDWYWLGFLGATVPGGMLLNVLMKHLFHRARPSFDEPLLTLSTYSYPSGHVAGSTLFYGVLAVMLMSKITAWRWRVYIALAAFSLVAMVALSRLYLGVHYLSDVLAAFAESIAWLSLSLMGIHAIWQRKYLR